MNILERNGSLAHQLTAGSWVGGDDSTYVVCSVYKCTQTCTCKAGHDISHLCVVYTLVIVNVT